MAKKLKILNDLLSKHDGNNYEDFSVCLELYFLADRAFGFISWEKIEAQKMSFNFTVNFWTTVDENGSITWTITENKISIVKTLIYNKILIC